MLPNKEAYRIFCNNNTDLFLFIQPWWLDIVCGESNWHVAIDYDNGNEIRGILPYYVNRKFGISHITMPPLTPFIGPVINYPEKNLKSHKIHSLENQIIHNLISQLPNYLYTYFICNPIIKNWYPFYLNNFYQTTRYLYVLNNINDLDLLNQNMHQSLRKKIKKARQILTIEENLDSDLIFNLLELTFKNQKSKNPISKDLIERIIIQASKRNAIKGYRARDQKNNSHAHLLTLYDSTTAYSLLLGTDPSLRQSGAAQLLYYHSIVKASERVSTYNFCGTMLPQIEPIIRPYGGQQVACHAVNHWRNRAIKALYVLSRK